MRRFCGILAAVALVFTIAFPMWIERMTGEREIELTYAILWGITSIALYCLAQGLEVEGMIHRTPILPMPRRRIAWIIRTAYGMLAGLLLLNCSLYLLGTIANYITLTRLSAFPASNVAEVLREILVNAAVVATAAIVSGARAIMLLRFAIKGRIQRKYSAFEVLPVAGARNH